VEGFIKYEYDSYGNWIKQILYNDEGKGKTPETVTEREIIYY